MNAITVIEKLRQFEVGYPYPDVQRLLAKMIISLLKIRNVEGYQLNIPRVVGNVRDFLVSRVERRGGSRSEAEMEMFEWTNLSFCFGDLSDNEAKEIIDECNRLSPRKEDSLGQFLAQKFGLEEQQQHDVYDFFCGRHQLAVGIAQATSGLCEEKFQFRPGEAIPDEVLTGLIQDYYVGRGYKTKKDARFIGISAEKGKEFLTVAVSNYGSSILISVLPI